jgi:hypothetical protein
MQQLSIKEWNDEVKDVEGKSIAGALELLEDMEVSKDALRYVSSLTEYARKLYLATLWIPDKKQRHEIGTQICIHGIGIKLLDDIMDHDSSMDVREQILGVYLTQVATANLCRIANGTQLMDWIKADYKNIWNKQLVELKSPPSDLDTWLQIAKAKTGQFLGCYATVACLAADRSKSIDNARAAMEAIGVLYTAKDDFEDYGKPDEGDGNIVNVLRGGNYTKAEVHSFFTYWYQKGMQSLAQQHTATSIDLTFEVLYRKCLTQGAKYMEAITPE